MDKLEIRQVLDAYGVRMHDAFLDEFFDLIAHSGEERIILSQFLRRVMMLSSLGNGVCKDQKIKPLKGTDGLSSMHIDTKRKNIRVICTTGSCCKLLLCAFDEKQGKKKTEYLAYVPIAAQRRYEMLQEKGGTLLWLQR